MNTAYFNIGNIRSYKRNCWITCTDWSTIICLFPVCGRSFSSSSCEILFMLVSLLIDTKKLCKPSLRHVNASSLPVVAFIVKWQTSLLLHADFNKEILQRSHVTISLSATTWTVLLQTVQDVACLTCTPRHSPSTIWSLISFDVRLISSISSWSLTLEDSPAFKYLVSSKLFTVTLLKRYDFPKSAF